MTNRPVFSVVSSLFLYLFAFSAYAQTWNAEQEAIWKIEQQQWKMSMAKDSSWIDTLAHPNLRFWEAGSQFPRDRDSLKQWDRYQSENSTTLEQELFPISVTVTGNVAVVQYHYMAARENAKKERETVTGHYTDVLIKDGDSWKFIAWEGGDDPKK